MHVFKYIQLHYVNELKCMYVCIYVCLYVCKYVLTYNNVPMPTRSWDMYVCMYVCVQMEHPERVTELVLRGIFLVREKELQWLYQGCMELIFVLCIYTYFC